MLKSIFVVIILSHSVASIAYEGERIYEGESTDKKEYGRIFADKSYCERAKRFAEADAIRHCREDGSSKCKITGSKKIFQENNRCSYRASAAGEGLLKFPLKDYKGITLEGKAKVMSKSKAVDKFIDDKSGKCTLKFTDWSNHFSDGQILVTMKLTGIGNQDMDELGWIRFGIGSFDVKERNNKIIFSSLFKGSEPSAWYEKIDLMIDKVSGEIISARYQTNQPSYATYRGSALKTGSVLLDFECTDFYRN
jgi:hypothetical protein